MNIDIMIDNMQDSSAFEIKLQDILEKIAQDDFDIVSEALGIGAGLTCNVWHCGCIGRFEAAVGGAGAYSTAR